MVGLKSALLLVWCKAPSWLCAYALPLCLLGAQQAAMIMTCCLGPGPGSQQPPDTPRNPKLTVWHAFPYAAAASQATSQRQKLGHGLLLSSVRKTAWVLNPMCLELV